MVSDMVVYWFFGLSRDILILFGSYRGYKVLVEVLDGHRVIAGI